MCSLLDLHLLCYSACADCTTRRRQIQHFVWLYETVSETPSPLPSPAGVKSWLAQGHTRISHSWEVSGNPTISINIDYIDFRFLPIISSSKQGAIHVESSETSAGAEPTTKAAGRGGYDLSTRLLLHHSRSETFCKVGGKWVSSHVSNCVGVHCACAFAYILVLISFHSRSALPTV